MLLNNPFIKGSKRLKVQVVWEFENIYNYVLMVDGISLKLSCRE
jgi:hypothetical protein